MIYLIEIDLFLLQDFHSCWQQFSWLGGTGTGRIDRTCWVGKDSIERYKWQTHTDIHDPNCCLVQSPKWTWYSHTTNQSQVSSYGHFYTSCSQIHQSGNDSICILQISWAPLSVFVFSLDMKKDFLWINCIVVYGFYHFILWNSKLNIFCASNPAQVFLFLHSSHFIELIEYFSCVKKKITHYSHINNNQIYIFLLTARVYISHFLSFA